MPRPAASPDVSPPPSSSAPISTAATDPTAGPTPPPGGVAKGDLGYGGFVVRTGYLRQDTRPVPFVGVKLRRFVRLDGTRLSLAKAVHGEVIWSFDIAGAAVEPYAADRKVSIWLTDSMRRRRRVIVLVADTRTEFDVWAFLLVRAANAVLERHYEMSEYINTGSFARVVRGRDRHTCREVAIKLIEKSNSPPSALRYMQREIDIMRVVRHPNVVECLDVFDTQLRSRIVMELAPGVLQDVLDARPGVPLPEDHARHVLRGLLRGLAYLHDAGIVHRDVKPSNILLSSLDYPYGPVKLSDFGLSNYMRDGNGPGWAAAAAAAASKSNHPQASHHHNKDDVNSLHHARSNHAEPKPVLSSAVGTLAFVAPELLEENYGAPVDLWSAGIVLYIMLTGGRLPFSGNTSAAVLGALRKGDFDMTNLKRATVSDSARSLLAALLNVDPERRLTALQALDHPWMRDGEEVVDHRESGEAPGTETRRFQGEGEGNKEQQQRLQMQSSREAYLEDQRREGSYDSSAWPPSTDYAALHPPSNASREADGSNGRGDVSGVSTSSEAPVPDGGAVGRQHPPAPRESANGHAPAIRKRTTQASSVDTHGRTNEAQRRPGRRRPSPTARRRMRAGVAVSLPSAADCSGSECPTPRDCTIDALVGTAAGARGHALLSL